jgi:serine/threonine-protein kinase RsbT
VTEIDDRTLLAALGRHVDATRARSILARARQSSPGLRGPLPPRQLLTRLGEGLRMYLGEAATRTAIAALTQLIAGKPAEALELELQHEPDIARARLAARDLCQALGTSPLVVQKLATIVSELARNMVAYAGGGTLKIHPCDHNRRCVHVTARDHGPGIANLEDILAGRYKSRSGLGLGILGTKRLADRFTIESHTTGTHVEVEVSF